MRYCILLCCVFSIELVNAQKNIVPNSSFESIRSFPDSYGQANKIDFWFQPAITNIPITFFYDSVYMPSDESHFQKKIYAHTGSAFIGIAIDLKQNSKDDRKGQYMAVRLKETLHINTSYDISMYVHPANSFRYAINKIEVMLLNDIYPKNIQNYITDNNYISLYADSTFLYPSGKWTKIQCRYKAQGNEKFICIGGFADNYKLKRTPFKLNWLYLISSGVTYYFIDDISAVKVKDSANSIMGGVEIPIMLNKDSTIKYILNDITFNNNEYLLSDSSLCLLEGIIYNLREYNEHVISIYGYTDNIGDSVYNVKLSFMRAKAIFNFLIQNGVNENKIHYQGFGGANPLFENTTNEGRRRNRRVEIIIQKHN